MPAKAQKPATIAQLEAELARERRVSQVLREVSLAMGSVVDLDRILELILDKITDIVEAERATLYLLDEAREELVSRVMVGQQVQTIRVPIGRGLAGVAARTGKPVRIADAYRDRRFLRDWDDLTGFRTKSILAVPMKNHVGWVMGVVQALNKRGGGTFSAEDEELLSALATHAAVTIDNSRLYLAAIQKNVELSETKEQLEQKVQELDLMFKLESAMGRAGTLEEMLRVVLGQATRALGARAAAVLLPEEEPEDGERGKGPSLATVYFYEVGERKVRTVLVRPGEGFIGSVFVNRRGAVASQLPHDSEGARKLDEALGFETTSAVGAPLDGEAIGAIALYNREEGRGFDDDDLYLLRLIAASVSTSVRLHRSRKAQERALRLSAIGRLLSGVMHDLKTPMTVIRGYVQLMAKADDGAARAEYAGLISKQFDLIMGMQREVLEFARGERTLWVRKVFLLPFLDGLRQSLEHELTGKPIELKAEAEDRGVARFDEVKVTRAINNLVRNAVEAMEHKKAGKIGLKVSRRDGSIIFSVSDNGSGIPEAIRGRLFDSFVTSGKKHGTGLGLALVKRVVDEHGGRVEVQSGPKGTTFHLVLPQAP